MTPNAISLELGDLFAQFRISGRSAVFDRYHIVSCADLQDVARRLASTFSGTSHLPQVDPRLVTSDDIGTRL